jgi:hypothetical protein
MKVALCFIISYQHILNKEQLWINWIKENQDIINVYFHYKDFNKIQSPWIKMHTIPPKLVHPTTYYNVVPAYMALISYAFHHDLDNKWFCLLTDSCVPIVSPAKFRKLFFENCRTSIFSWKPAYWNLEIHRRANLRLLKKQFWLANDPWFTLSRDHVHKCIIFLAAKNDIYQIVNAGGLANESIFAIILQTFNELTNPDKLLNAVSTITDWSRMSSPTSPYLFKEATPENINIISNLLKENPHAMFLRKVDRAFPDQAILDLYGNENIDFVIENENKNTFLIVTQDHGYYMCIMASMNLISVIYALKYGQYKFAIGPFCVWFNSINYWRNPIYGLRRNMDICLGLIALSFHIFNSHKSTYGLTYQYMMAITLLFYPFSWILYKYEYFWMSTIVHSMLHVFGNLANVILYSGL